jgi:hypothetical protein
MLRGRSSRSMLRRRQRALGVDGVEDLKRVSGKNLLSAERGVEDLKRVSGKNLLSAERAVCVPDIYIRGQMRDAHSLSHVIHFFRRVAHYF